MEEGVMTVAVRDGAVAVRDGGGGDDSGGWEG